MLIRGRIRHLLTGGEVPAVAFNYSAPSGALGASVSITIGDTQTQTIPLGEALIFEIGLSAAVPPVYTYVPIIAEGKIAGRSARYAWTGGKPVGRPGDTLEASAIDALADRWQLAPPRPVIMFNPQFIDEATLRVSEADTVKTEGGIAPIYPVIEPIPDLRLWDVLNRAYTNIYPNLKPGIEAQILQDSMAVGTGAGFDRVITNLPNYPIERADFTLTGGWHEGAKEHFTLFEPIAYEDRNILYIWDLSKGLPLGVQPKVLPMSCYIELTETTPPADIINAILLSYTGYLPAGGFSVQGAIPSRRIIHEDPIEGGDPGTPGFYRQEVEREIEEWKDLQTGAVVLTNEINKVTTNYGFRVSLAREVVTSRETLEVTYQGDKKTGHNLTMEASYPNPASSTLAETPLAAVYFEECEIEWSADINNPGDSVIRRTQTSTRGTVLVEEANEIAEGETAPKKTLTPILDAARGNNIILSPDEQDKRDVHQYVIEDRDILTTIETFTDTGTGIAQMETARQDHLKGVSYPPVIQTRPGSRSTRAGRAGGNTPTISGKTYTELIIDKRSVSKYGFRKAIPLSVGWLGAIDGRALAHDTLRRKAKPRRSVSVTLPGLDLAVHRGSYFKGYTRSGDYIVFVVTGFTIQGSNLGRPNQDVFMTLEGLEVV